MFGKSPVSRSAIDNYVQFNGVKQWAGMLTEFRLVKVNLLLKQPFYHPCGITSLISVLHQDTPSITISVQWCQTMGRYLQRVQACQGLIALVTSLP